MTVHIDDTAHCRRPGIDPEVFHPTGNSDTTRIDKAKGTCSGCPFIDPCLNYALRNKVEGVWGATTDKERAGIRERHGIKAEPLSFGTGPTNATEIRRMYRRGKPTADIAAHLGLSYEAVRLVIRADEARRLKEGLPLHPNPDVPASCPDCDRTMRRESLYKHRASHCAGRQVAS